MNWCLDQDYRVRLVLNSLVAFLFVSLDLFMNRNRALNEPEVRRVAILGHSYVGRLTFGQDKRYTEGAVPYRVQRFWQSGATIESLQNTGEWTSFCEFRPHLVFLYIGGNDINAGSSVRVITARLEQIVERVEAITGISRSCQLFTLEPRTTPRFVSPEGYARIRNAVNRFMRCRRFFLRNRLVHFNIASADLVDGVHISRTKSQQLATFITSRINEYAARNW